MYAIQIKDFQPGPFSYVTIKHLVLNKTNCYEYKLKKNPEFAWGSSNNNRFKFTSAVICIKQVTEICIFMEFPWPSFALNSL